MQGGNTNSHKSACCVCINMLIVCKHYSWYIIIETYMLFYAFFLFFSFLFCPCASWRLTTRSVRFIRSCKRLAVCERVRQDLQMPCVSWRASRGRSRGRIRRSGSRRCRRRASRWLPLSCRRSPSSSSSSSSSSTSPPDPEPSSSRPFPYSLFLHLAIYTWCILVLYLTRPRPLSLVSVN